MKTTMILTVISLFLFNVKISAQTQEDSLAIAAACRNYVEGWAGGDMERVEKGVSPELVKRTISRDKDGFCFTNNMSRSQLLFVTKMNKGGVKAPDLESGKPYNPDIKIFDITGDYALVKAVSAKYGFFDYCQLAKFNGEWQIINVLWGPLPPKK